MDLEWIIGLSSAGGVALASGISYLKGRFSGTIDIDEYINSDWNDQGILDSREGKSMAVSASLGGLYFASTRLVTLGLTESLSFAKTVGIASGVSLFVTVLVGDIYGKRAKEVAYLKNQLKELEANAGIDDNKDYFALKDKLSEYVDSLERKYGNSMPKARELFNAKVYELEQEYDPHKPADTPEGVVQLVVPGSGQASPE